MDITYQTPGVDYCPLKEGEDSCMGCSPCNYKGAEPENKVLEIANRIRIMQAAKEAKKAAVIGD
jgi:hypothetical protein